MPQLIASLDGIEIKHLYLEKDRTTLGRNPNNDIVFNSPVVSGEHCVFELRGIADVYVEDMSSTNGTYINGHMIKLRQQLRDGDVIVVGHFKIAFLTASLRDHQRAHEETSAMSLSALGSLGLPGTSGPLLASLKTLSGASQGLDFALVKAVTTFGTPGVAVVSVSHRRDGYYVAHVDGDQRPTLNGKQLGADAVLLADHDVLELADMAMEFLLQADKP